MGPTQTCIQWAVGGSFPEVRQPKHEVDRSPPSSAEVKNEWSCTSTPSVRLHGVDSDNFTFAMGIQEAN